jgi:hypothetical protein
VRDTVDFITIALLPDPVRRQYGFSSIPPPLVRRAVVFAGGDYVKRVVMPVLPDRLRHVPAV